METASSSSWVRRPLIATALKAVVFVVPILISMAFIMVVTRIVPRPDGLVPTIAWFVVLTLAATVVVARSGKALRGLLPIVALFNISLVFPDHAPSRFKLAMRKNTVRQLQRRVADGTLEEQTPQEAAEHLLMLAAALNDHDRLTRGHTERVRAYSLMIGEELGLDEDDLAKLHWAGLIHDVGKLEVPAEILSKDGRPTEEEWQILRSHPEMGGESGCAAASVARTMGRRRDPAPRTVRRHRVPERARRRGHLDLRTNRCSGRCVRRHHLGPVLQAAALGGVRALGADQVLRHTVRSRSRPRLPQHRNRPAPIGHGSALLARGALRGRPEHRRSRGHQRSECRGERGDRCPAIGLIPGVDDTEPERAAPPAAEREVETTTSTAAPSTDQSTSTSTSTSTTTTTGPLEAATIVLDAVAGAPATIDISAAYPGETLVITVLEAPEVGSFSIDDDGVALFLAPPDFTGELRAEVRVCRPSGECVDSAIRIVVGAWTGEPVPLDDAADGLEDTSVTIDVVANDASLDGSPLTVVAVERVGGWNGDAASIVANRVVYVPAPQRSGAVELVYSVANDGGLTAEGTISIDIAAVNDAPRSPTRAT